jgi:hypothetical protein
VYWGEIQLCKLRAGEYTDEDYTAHGKNVVVFTSAMTGIELVNDDEIRVNDKLYDVEKKESSEGVTTYFAYSDEEEDAYLRNLNNWGKDSSRQSSLPGNKVNIHLAKFISLEKDHDKDNITFNQQDQIIKVFSDSFFYTAPLKLVCTPPPDAVPA